VRHGRRIGVRDVTRAQLSSVAVIHEEEAGLSDHRRLYHQRSEAVASARFVMSIGWGGCPTSNHPFIILYYFFFFKLFLSFIYLYF
jgi:hypothetical protein